MDELQGVGSPELREALVFARLQDGAVTADDLAAAAGVHRNVARSRLERLVEAGLLGAGYERSSWRAGPGGGRPAKFYSVVPAVTSVEFPARRYEALIGLLVDALPTGQRAERLREVGVAFGGQLAEAAGLRPARGLRTGLERMCAAVRRLGYHVTLEHVDGATVVVRSSMCPLRPLVRARADAAEIDRGMWAALASRAVAGLEPDAVACETAACLSAGAPCRVELRFAWRPALR